MLKTQVWKRTHKIKKAKDKIDTEQGNKEKKKRWERKAPPLKPGRDYVEMEEFGKYWISAQRHHLLEVGPVLQG